MLVGLIRERGNANNDRLNGDYSGTLYPNGYPAYVINATFDGKGNCEGAVNVEGKVLSFSTSYIVAGYEFKMSFDLNDTLSVQMIGNVIEEGDEVQGDLQLWDIDDYVNGTYSLLKK